MIVASELTLLSVVDAEPPYCAVRGSGEPNFSLLLRWFEELLRVLSLILCHALLAAPLHLTRCRKTFFRPTKVEPTMPLSKRALSQLARCWLYQFAEKRFLRCPMGNIDSKPVCATHERFATIRPWTRILRIARPDLEFFSKLLDATQQHLMDSFCSSRKTFASDGRFCPSRKAREPGALQAI